TRNRGWLVVAEIEAPILDGGRALLTANAQRAIEAAAVGKQPFAREIWLQAFDVLRGRVDDQVARRQFRKGLERARSASRDDVARCCDGGGAIGLGVKGCDGFRFQRRRG